MPVTDAPSATSMPVATGGPDQRHCALPRTVEELEQLRDRKRRELEAVEDELSTAMWLAEYDGAPGPR
ncbi:hypothetical protein [Pseudorhodoferax sp.]|uniref:hypothetical protein n=1 Tax=Pseudorhodoferax sp. TaxID=1993553 RepID=UPI0039E23A1F